MSLQRYSSSAKTIVPNESCFFSDSHSASAFQIFQDLRANEEVCDAFICSGSNRFPVHRVVLAGTCPLFREKLAASQADGEKKRSCDEFEIPKQFDKLAVVRAGVFVYG